MTKSTTALLTAALLLILCGSPALARDDGGFGMPSTAAAPKALGDNTSELIARGDAAYPDIPDFAAIEPAAGDDAATKNDDGKKAEKATTPAPSAAPKPAQQ